MVGIGLNSKEMANFIVLRYTIKIKHVQYNSNWYNISGTCSSEANLKVHTVEDIKKLTFRIRRTIVLRLHSLQITVAIVLKKNDVDRSR